MSLSREQLVRVAYHQALNGEHDPDDCLFLQLTRREIWLLLYGLLWTCHLEPKLEENCCDLLEKMSEALDCQKPHWRNGYTDPSD